MFLGGKKQENLRRTHIDKRGEHAKLCTDSNPSSGLNLKTQSCETSTLTTAPPIYIFTYLLVLNSLILLFFLLTQHVDAHKHVYYPLIAQHKKSTEMKMAFLKKC